MRLTLRTLLAYLEDELKPAESKEIGQKISESPVATSLAQRVREVMRRRRLSAEDLSATGLDANLVGEYLDGSLAPQQVADVEKVCLGSDAHLAEVAACHQILTLVLGEPIEISEQSRERMYALGDEGSVGQAEIPEPVSVPQASVSESTPFPAHLMRKPWWQSSMPLLVPVVLIGVWLVLIRIDPSLNFFAADPGEVELQVASLDKDQVDAHKIEQRGDIPVVVPRQGDEPPPIETSVKPGLPGQGIDPEPPPDLPESDANATAGTLPEENTNNTDDGNSTSIPDPPEIPKSGTPDKPIDVPAEPALQVVGRYQSSEGVLLSYDEGKQGWYPVPYELDLLPQTSLAVPVPFTAMIRMGDKTPLATLVGGARATLVTDSPAASAGFQLHEGRLLLEAIEQETSPVAIVSGTLHWRVELIDANSRVGIELEPLRVFGYEQAMPENHFRLRVIVSRGSVRLASETSQVMVTAGQEVILHESQLQATLPGDDTSPPTPRPEPGTLSPEMVTAYDLAPQWMQLQLVPKSLIHKRYFDEFMEHFDPDFPAAENMEPLIGDDRPLMSQYAVVCQGLVDDTRDLVKTMRVNELEDSRLAAANELRLWLPRHPEGKEEYRVRIELAFPGDDSVHLDRLLWGYTFEDARDPIVSKMLVDLLDHGQPILRELAFLEVARLTGLENSYKALISPTQRRSWVQRWQRMVRDQGSILVPEEE